MRLIFSKNAQLEYDEIIKYLHDNLGKQAATKFSESLKQNLKQVKQFPESFSFYYNTDKRKFMVNPYITVIYYLNKEAQCVEILSFWFSRSNPEIILQYL